MSSRKPLFALLGGLALGALIGILMAPDKGSETRKKASDKGKKIIDDLREKINGAKEDSVH